MYQSSFNSPIGYFLLKADAVGITAILFDDNKIEIEENENSEIKKCKQQLTEYFDGKRKIFDIQISMQGTDFQKRVWAELLKIPFGKLTTYKKQAEQMGDEKVIRAMASANGKNKINIIIPCHRVIGTDNSLTGYGGGLWRKQWLIEHEQKVEGFINKLF